MSMDLADMPVSSVATAFYSSMTRGSLVPELLISRIAIDENLHFMRFVLRDNLHETRSISARNV
jgi:hypothetical protein